MAYNPKKVDIHSPNLVNIPGGFFLDFEANVCLKGVYIFNNFSSLVVL